MYVDPSIKYSESSMSTKKDDVKEATEALKGMLGLCVSTPVVTTTGKNTPQSEASGTGTSETEVLERNQATTKQKKKKNKKKKPQGDVMLTPPKPKQNEPAGGSSKQSKTKKQGPAQPKKKRQETTENFAWSAFQSSPDASKLPIPAFSSDLKPKEDEDVPPPVDLNLNLDKTSPVKGENKSTDPMQVGLQDPAASTGESGMNPAALPVGPNLVPPFVPSRLPMGPPPPNFFPPPMPHGAFAPPGFVTIRVQLPPVLPANRTLIVGNPAGFPVQVHIPEEYAPNQIISVNVPSGPPLPPMPYPPHHHR